MAIGGSGVTRDGGYTSYASGSANAYIPILFAKKMLRRFYAETAYEMISNTD